MSTIRIATFNTLFGGHADFGFGTADRWDGQIDFLRTLRPDILALQFSGRTRWCSARSRRR
ncbi:hypothetical protein ACFY7C_00245 [Streptomyces sp. NPDC012769]|uniref:hypothetical protein n=1 Tax=Streptomyces sp. NPDC012769 TaxID=3364848 RepID=UPI0036BC9A86